MLPDSGSSKGANDICRWADAEVASTRTSNTDSLRINVLEPAAGADTHVTMAANRNTDTDANADVAAAGSDQSAG